MQMVFRRTLKYKVFKAECCILGLLRPFYAAPNAFIISTFQIA